MGIDESTGMADYSAPGSSDDKDLALTRRGGDEAEKELTESSAAIARMVGW